MNIKERLLKEVDKTYKDFNQKLIPNINNILGIRVPVLRKISKEIYKNNWQDFLKQKPQYFEEAMLQGMIIGLIKDEPNAILEYIETFIPQINNWAVCDCFCSSLKFTKNNKELVWNFLHKYLNSSKEYEIRFVLVMLLNYYIEEKYLNKIFKIIENYQYNDYYAHMGAAWLISICYIEYPEETTKYLLNSNIDTKTYNKSIQKIIESNKIDKKTKNKLKTFKK